MSERQDATWKGVLRSVWPYATASSALLFVACSAFGALLAKVSGATGSLSYVLAMTDPALAALGMLVVCLLAPSVFAARPFGLLHAFTLPTVYMAIVFGVKTLGRNSAGSIQRFEQAQRVDLLWLDPLVVLEAWAFLVVVFLIASRLRREPKPPEP